MKTRTVVTWSAAITAFFAVVGGGILYNQSIRSIEQTIWLPEKHSVRVLKPGEEADLPEITRLAAIDLESAKRVARVFDLTARVFIARNYVTYYFISPEFPGLLLSAHAKLPVAESHRFDRKRAPRYLGEGRVELPQTSRLFTVTLHAATLGLVLGGFILGFGFSPELLAACRAEKPSAA